MCMFCRSLFVFLYFSVLPLWCLFFFDLWILITPLVSSSSSYATKQIFLKIQIRLVMENREFAEDWVFIKKKHKNLKCKQLQSYRVLYCRTKLIIAMKRSTLILIYLIILLVRKMANCLFVFV